MGYKWNIRFLGIPLENSREYVELRKGSPFLPLETFPVELRVPFTSFQKKIHRFQAIQDYRHYSANEPFHRRPKYTMM